MKKLDARRGGAPRAVERRRSQHLALWGFSAVLPSSVTLSVGRTVGVSLSDGIMSVQVVLSNAPCDRGGLTASVSCRPRR
jgi:hypothetical protein